MGGAPLSNREESYDANFEIEQLMNQIYNIEEANTAKDDLSDASSEGGLLKHRDCDKTKPISTEENCECGDPSRPHCAIV